MNLWEGLIVGIGIGIVGWIARSIVDRSPDRMSVAWLERARWDHIKEEGQK